MDLERKLTPNEARVLGCLIEKELSTPEYYPLTLNALVNACKQKQNRDPLMELDEGEVMEAIDGLREQRLAGHHQGATARVSKYAHRLEDSFGLNRRQLAVVAELLLRGPQTAGELRSRTARMCTFENLPEALEAIESLTGEEDSLLVLLEREPGRKERRYAQLLNELPAPASPAYPEDPVRSSQPPPKAEEPGLKDEVKQLREELDVLKAEFAALKEELGVE